VGKDVSDHGGVLAIELAHQVVVFCLIVNYVGRGELCLDLGEPDRKGGRAKREAILLRRGKRRLRDARVGLG